MYVFYLFILDIKFVGRTSRGHTGFFIHLLSAVRALLFLARRIQPFLSLVDREVEFCVLTIKSFSTRWAFFVFLFFYFLVRKIPFAGIELTSQRVEGYEVPLSYRGDRSTNLNIYQYTSIQLNGLNFSHRKEKEKKGPTAWPVQTRR